MRAWLLVVSFASACTSSTVISSRPTGANVYVDGMDIGPSPAQWSSTVWAGTKNNVRLTLPGYSDAQSIISADQWSVGRVVVSVLCFLPGLLWSTDYRPSYEFALQPLQTYSPGYPPPGYGYPPPGYAPQPGYAPPPPGYAPQPAQPPPPPVYPPSAPPPPPPLPVR